MSEPNLFTRAGREARRARRARRRELNAAGRPDDVVLGILTAPSHQTMGQPLAHLVAFRLVPGGVEVQREAGGAWERYAATGARRTLRPWVLRIDGPHGPVERFVIRGPVWRDGMGDVGEPRTTARTLNQLEVAPIILLWVLYAIPVRLLSLTTDLRAARRLQEALG